MAKKKQSKLPVPSTDGDVNTYITAVAEAQTAIDRLTAKANERVQAINAELAAAVAEHEAVIKGHAAALFTYFEKHREALTDGGKRQSAVFATGILGQRLTPPRTKIENEERVIELVVQRRLTAFYESKTVLRRDGLLANQALARTIPGVSFVQDRIIFVKPDRFDVEIDLKKKTELVT